MFDKKRDDYSERFDAADNVKVGNFGPTVFFSNDKFLSNGS